MVKDKKIEKLANSTLKTWKEELEVEKIFLEVNPNGLNTGLLSLINYFKLDKQDCTLDNAKLLISKIAHYDTFDELNNTLGQERKLAILVIKNCTDIEQLKEWRNCIKEQKYYKKYGIAKKYNIAKDFFQTDDYYDPNIPNGAEFDWGANEYD